MKFRVIGSAALVLICGASAQAGGPPPPPSVFATGLIAPAKIDASGAALIVAERGTGANDGRVSVIDRLGTVLPVVTGLPSGIEVTGGASGSQGVLVRGCCVVDVTIGEGDTLRFEGPPREVPNPLAPLSPLFSAVVRLIFDRPLAEVSTGFALTVANHATLADGQPVQLENASGQKLWLKLVADLKDFRPDPLINVRASNPFAITSSYTLFGALVADAGQNSIVEVGASGPPKTVIRFPRIANPAGVVPPFSDAVPTSVRHYRGSQYLVSLLTGQPFTSGNASIRLLDAESGASSTLIAGLTTVTDVLVVGSAIYVLEISTNLAQGAPGRLLRFRSPTASPEIIASGLIGASGVTYSGKHQALFVTEAFVGRITKVPL